MSRSECIRKSGLLVLVLILTACTSNPSGIGTHVISCCANRSYETFDVTAVDIPAFLGPLMVSNFSVAFAGRGMQPVSDGGDLNVILRFEQVDLARPEIRDDFDERISPGGEVRFIARIIIDMKDAKTGETVWSGSIQRTHDISPGEYMHTGRASVALLDAFSALLMDYPGKKK